MWHLLTHLENRHFRKLHRYETTNDELNPRESFYQFMYLVKNEQVYWEFYRSRCEMISKIISIACAIPAMASFAVWEIWIERKVIYSAISIILGLLQVFKKEVLPFDKRSNLLFCAIFEYKNLYRQVEERWQSLEKESKRGIDYSLYTNSENELSRRFDTIQEQYAVLQMPNNSRGLNRKTQKAMERLYNINRSIVRDNESDVIPNNGSKTIAR